MHAASTRTRHAPRCGTAWRPTALAWPRVRRARASGSERRGTRCRARNGARMCTHPRARSFGHGSIPSGTGSQRQTVWPGPSPRALPSHRFPVLLFKHIYETAHGARARCRALSCAGPIAARHRAHQGSPGGRDANACKNLPRTCIAFRPVLPAHSFPGRGALVQSPSRICRCRTPRRFSATN